MPTFFQKLFRNLFGILKCLFVCREYLVAVHVVDIEEQSVARNFSFRHFFIQIGKIFCSCVPPAALVIAERPFRWDVERSGELTQLGNDVRGIASDDKENIGGTACAAKIERRSLDRFLARVKPHIGRERKEDAPRIVYENPDGIFAFSNEQERDVGVERVRLVIAAFDGSVCAPGIDVPHLCACPFAVEPSGAFSQPVKVKVFAGFEPHQPAVLACPEKAFVRAFQKDFFG